MEEIVHVAVGGVDDLKDSIFSKSAKTTDFDCYTPAVRRFSEKCFKLSEVSTHHISTSSLAQVTNTFLSVLMVCSLSLSGGPCYAPRVHPFQPL